MANVAIGGKRTDLLAARSDVDKMAAFLTALIMIVGGVVLVIFTAISIRDIRFDNIPIFFGETTFTKFGLGLFFAHWSWGVRTDLYLQARYYQTDPNRGKLTWRSRIGIAGFIVFFIALFWWHSQLVVFQLLLLGFIGMNFYSWGAIIAQSNKMARSSRKELRHDEDWFALEQLELVCDYMNGRWQIIRFLVLMFLALAQVIVALAIAGWWAPLDPVRHGLANLFGPPLLPHLPGLLFFLFVLVSTAWMGGMRMRVLFGTKVINDLLATYTMERREPRAAPATPRRAAPKAGSAARP